MCVCVCVCASIQPGVSRGGPGEESRGKEEGGREEREEARVETGGLGFKASKPSPSSLAGGRRQILCYVEQRKERRRTLAIASGCFTATASFLYPQSPT